MVRACALFCRVVIAVGEGCGSGEGVDRPEDKCERLEVGRVFAEETERLCFGGIVPAVVTISDIVENMWVQSRLVEGRAVVPTV
jgi:hypothetical protein